MSVLEILSIERPEPDVERLWGWSIDRPVSGTHVEAAAVQIAGWVLGRQAPAVAVEVLFENSVVRRLPLREHRPDVAAVYPRAHEADRSGFSTCMSVLAAMPELTLEVRAVTRDQARVPLGLIRARRRRSEVDDGADQALVSVVIPCYRQAHFLGESIESVLRQTYPHVEVLVVDDGSPDNASEVASRYPGVRRIRQDNEGLSAARNTGLRQSDGEYVVFLDADDRLLPEALQAGIDAFRAHPACAFVYGHHRLINLEGTMRTDVLPAPVEEGHYVALLRRNVIGMHATVMYRRSVLETVGGFDPSIDACEDYDLYLRLARSFPIQGHGTLIAEYRQHSHNMTRESERMLRSSLSVLGAQGTHARQWAESRLAYDVGMRFWRDGFGYRLVRDVRARLHSREWREALRGVLVLLRYDPGRVALLALPGPVRRWRERRLRRQECPPVGRVGFGSLRRVTPISRVFGFDRGQPVDRYYIERFLARHAVDVRGHVLEIGDDSYTRKFGGQRVTICDVLHVAGGNPRATIVADLSGADHIPSNTFDCIIVTQTLHLIYEVRAAISTLHRVLRPGGVLLATLPGISQLSQDEWRETWCWAFTGLSARRLFEEVFPVGNVALETYGNVLVAIAFLHGLAQTELRQDELDYRDPLYPVSITLRAVKS